jgi:hypothetical protein
MVAIVPMPMAMLVVAAVLEAAMATPSATPRERRSPVPGPPGGAGGEDAGGMDGDGWGDGDGMEGSSRRADEGRAARNVMEHLAFVLRQSR